MASRLQTLRIVVCVARIIDELSLSYAISVSDVLYDVMNAILECRSCVMSRGGLNSGRSSASIIH